MNTNLIIFEQKKELAELTKTIHSKLGQANRKIDDARADLLDAGEAFLQARLLIPQDREFGRWCDEIDETMLESWVSGFNEFLS
jgi:hypothetical protein